MKFVKCRKFVDKSTNKEDMIKGINNIFDEFGYRGALECRRRAFIYAAQKSNDGYFNLEDAKDIINIIFLIRRTGNTDVVKEYKSLDLSGLMLDKDLLSILKSTYHFVEIEDTNSIYIELYRIDFNNHIELLLMIANVKIINGEYNINLSPLYYNLNSNFKCKSLKECREIIMGFGRLEEQLDAILDDEDEE